MEKFQLVFTKETNFEYGKKSIVLVLFGKTSISVFSTKFLNRKRLLESSCKILGCWLDVKLLQSKAVVMGKHDVEHQGKSHNTVFLDLWNFSYFDAKKNKINETLIGSFF